MILAIYVIGAIVTVLILAMSDERDLEIVIAKVLVWPLTFLCHFARGFRKAFL
jgi:hypothetical protein